jgi:hypothetical protein
VSWQVAGNYPAAETILLQKERNISLWGIFCRAAQNKRGDISRIFYMPRLLTDRKPSSKLRKISFVTPFSPFQKLVESRRVEKRLSYADLAKKVSDKKLQLHPGTLWIWLHTKNGHPHPRSCTPEHLRRLSRVLNVPLPQLKESLDASRHIFTKSERAVPTASLDGWKEFVGWLDNDKRTKISRTVVLNMAKRFMAGATASTAASK